MYLTHISKIILNFAFVFDIILMYLERRISMANKKQETKNTNKKNVKKTETKKVSKEVVKESKSNKEVKLAENNKIVKEERESKKNEMKFLNSLNILINIALQSMELLEEY